MRIRHVLDLMNELAPPQLAADWDNCGLQVGNPDDELKGIALCVDPTYEAIREAVALGANLLIAHHPLLFKATKRLDLRSEPGRSIAELIRHGVTLYGAHTNLDATAVNVALARAVGLKGTQLLDTTGAWQRYCVAFYVPVSHAQAVKEAAWAAGAGASAAYDRAAYEMSAQGTFRPLSGASPAAGAVGAQSEGAEVRLEFSVDSRRLQAVLKAVRSAHPYEEPALDVHENVGAGEPYGYGLVGDLEEPMPLSQLALKVKAGLGLPAVRRVGEGQSLIRRVAWLGGSGGDYFKAALKAGAQALITGEVRHHAALDGMAAGLCFIEAGHVGTEYPVVPYLRELLCERLGEQVPIHLLAQRDPFEVV